MTFKKDVSRRDVTLSKFLAEENLSRDKLKTFIIKGITETQDLLELRNWLCENGFTKTKIKKTVLVILINDLVKEEVLKKDAPKKGKQSYWYTISN